MKQQTEKTETAPMADASADSEANSDNDLLEDVLTKRSEREVAQKSNEEKTTNRGNESEGSKAPPGNIAAEFAMIWTRAEEAGLGGIRKDLDNASGAAATAAAGAAVAAAEEVPLTVSAEHALPPPALDRASREQRRQHIDTQPGAVAYSGIAAGGEEDLGRRASVNYSSFVADTSVSFSQAQGHNSEQGLVTANPVSEENGLPQAEHVDLETAAEKQRQKRKSQMQLLFGIAFLVLVVVVVVVTTVASRKSSATRPATTAEPTASFTTQVPSAGPTTGVLELWKPTLPNQTLERVEIFGTPQWKALAWLEEHPNVTYFDEDKATQLFALATFFYAFEGEHWYQPIKDKWMDYEKDECEWFSSSFGYFYEGKYQERLPGRILQPSCDEMGNFIFLYLTGLRLGGLSPSLPPEIVLLTSLSRIQISSCGLNNTMDNIIPPETQLHTLDLSSLSFGSNAIMGPVPTEMGLFANLILLELAGNELTGPIPSELALLSTLKTFTFELNKLSGVLPTELGMMEAMHTFSVFNNLFSGTIPSELGQWSNCSFFLLSGTSLTGTLPTEMGQWSLCSFLSLGDTGLTGTLPTEIGRLTALRSVHLHSTTLTGPLVTEIGQLTALRWLYLSDSRLTGPLPSEIGLMTSLSVLELQNNSFTGQIPNELNISALHLYDNDFSGTVPQHLCDILFCDCSEPISTSTCVGL